MLGLTGLLETLAFVSLTVAVEVDAVEAEVVWFWGAMVEKILGY